MFDKFNNRKLETIYKLEQASIFSVEKSALKTFLCIKFLLIVEVRRLKNFKYCKTFTAQKMKFSIKDFFSKCDQIRGKLWIWSHSLKKSLMENFIFYAVIRSKNALE